MSNPLNYLCASKNQSFPQEKCKLFKAEPEGGTLRTPPLLELESGRSGAIIQPLLSHPVNYKHKCGEATVDAYMSGTKEDVKTSAIQFTGFTPTQSSTSLTSSTSLNFTMMSSACRGQNSDVKYYSSCSPFGPVNRNEMNTFRKGEHKTQSLVSLRGDDEVVTDPQSSCTNYTPELATEILQRYGLEKDDLEDLLSYPEDQVTAENLPLILQKIRTQKQEKKMEKSESSSKTQSIATRPDGKTGTEGAQIYQDRVSPDSPKPRGVTDSGPSGKSPVGVMEETGGTVSTEAHTGGFVDTRAHTGTGAHTSGMVCTGAHTGATVGTVALAHTGRTVDTGSHTGGTIGTDPTVVKIGGLVFLLDHKDRATSLSSIKSSVISPISDLTDQPRTQPDLFPRDADMRCSQSSVVFLKDPKPQFHLAPTPAPGGPPIVDRRAHDVCSNDHSKSQGDGLKVESAKHQRADQQRQRDQSRLLQHLKQPVSVMGKVSLPQGFSAPVRPRIITHPTGQPPPTLSPHMMQTRFSRQSLSTGSVFMGLPPPAMMEDYAATTPGTFPYTCSLCNKQCVNIKDWISHQNMSHHLEQCKLLRKRYPKWDGHLPSFHSFPDQIAKLFPSASAQTLQHQDQNTRTTRSSKSSSNSPQSRGWLEDRRDSSSNSSRSPSPYNNHNSKSRRRKHRIRSGDSQRFRSRSRSRDKRLSFRHRPRLRSPERGLTPKGREKKSSSSTRRRSSTERSSDKQKSSKAKRLTKRLLKTPALQSLLGHQKLKAVVQTLVPVVLSELRKMKSSSAISSSHSATKNMNTKISTAEASSTKPQETVSVVPFTTSPKKQKAKQQLTSSVSVSITPQTTKSPLPPVSASKTSVTTKQRKTTIASKFISKAKMVVSKAQKAFAKQVLKTHKTGSIAEKRLEVKNRDSKHTRSKKSKRPAEKSGDGDSSKQPKIPETNTSLMASNKTSRFEKTSEMTDVESNQDKEIHNVFASEAEPASTTQALTAQMDSLQTAGDVNKEAIIPEQSSKELDMSERQPDAAVTLEAENLETNVKESVVLPENTAKTNTTEIKQAEVDVGTKNDAGHADVMKGSTEVKGQKPTGPKMSPAKTDENDPPKMQQNTPVRALETGVEALQENAMSDPKSPGPHLKTQTEGLDQQTAGSSSDPKAKQTVGALKTKTKEKMRTQKKNSSGVYSKNSKISTKMAPSTNTEPAAAVSPLTVGEKIETLLNQERISCLNKRNVMSPKLFSCNKRTLLITNLPECLDGGYREDDVANLLCPFGFIYKGNNIYIIPQKRMAFALMPHAGNIQNIIRYFDRNNVFLRGSKLVLKVVSVNISMMPFGFYLYLMKMMRSQKVKDDGSSTIFIHNISPGEARHLRETLMKIGSVKNYLPLLNKVFIQFNSPRDADRLGVWYSLLNRTDHHVYRLKIPPDSRRSQPPKHPAKALPDTKDIEASAVPTAKCGVPQGSASPFWITMRTNPFVFPTSSPWFNIPNYRRVKGIMDIEKAASEGSEFSTIMLTGLPQENYNDKDIAKLVWRYFPKQNLHSLYYNLTVLPLQRRVFVYFSSWNACCDFVLNHIKNPVSVKGCELKVHFVLEDMQPGFSEEMMYRNVMKWSNTPVSELHTLEERLLCVEVSEMSLHLVMMVMKEVASVAAFVNFLPLANRILVEMSESRGVTEAVERISLSASSKQQLWSKVGRVDSLKTFKQRLQDSAETLIRLEPDLSTKPTSVKTETKPVRKQRTRAAKTAALSRIHLFESCSSEIKDVLLDQRRLWSQLENVSSQSSVTAERLCYPSEAPQTSRDANQLDSEEPKESLAESKSETSEMDPPAKRQKLQETNQSRSLEVKEVKKEGKIDAGDEKCTTSEKDNEIFHVVNEIYDQKEEESSSETPGLKRDQILHQEGLQVSGDAAENQAADDQGSIVIQVPEEDAAINQVYHHREEIVFEDSDGSVQQTPPTGSSERRHEEVVKTSNPTEIPDQPDEGHKTLNNTRNTLENSDHSIQTSPRTRGEKTSTRSSGFRDSAELSEEKCPKPEDEDHMINKCERESSTDEESTKPGSEPEHQIVDSLKDPLLHEGTMTEEESETNDLMPSGSSVVVKEENLLQGVGDDSSTEGSGTRLPGTDVWKQEEPLTISSSEEICSTLKHVSNDEEEYPDETAEKEKRQTASKEELMGGQETEVESEAQEMETLDEVEEGEVTEGELEERVPPVKTDEEEEEDSHQQSESSDEDELEGCLEEGGHSRTEVITKHLSESGGPEAKRFCSLSNPTSSSSRGPVGQEFVELKCGFFCSLCSIFYLNESKTEDEHCCSRAHYDNLKNYLHKHQLSILSSTEDDQGSGSD